MRGLTRAALAALPLALMLALTGCGSNNDGGDQVASAASAKPSAAGATASVNPGEMGVKFAQCMRENGIDMADPEPGKGIQLKFDESMPKETVDKAMEACRKYSPQANGAGGGNPKGAENGRKFAQCMRENGVDFPDPDPAKPGQILIDKKMADDPDFAKAQEACNPILSAAAGQ